MLKVLYVTSEAFPFIKTGGLADVSFSLPKELRKLGVDIRVVLPQYSAIPDKFKEKMQCIKEIYVPVGWRMQYCGIKYAEYEGIPYYFIDNEYYFKRDNGYSVYGFYDEAERFAFFNRAILEMIKNIDFYPDIIHSNDWQSGMVSPFLDIHYKQKGEYLNIKTIFTIHNLKYQGIFSSKILDELLNVSKEYFDNMGPLEFYGGVNFMKGGINYSNIVTTVSPTYSQEIQTPFYGHKLHDLLRMKGYNLHGILNGIDYDMYNPGSDKNIFVNYTIDSLELKMENKLKLQQELNLPQKPETPLLAMVTRLDSMKGLDLVIGILDELLYKTDMQMVILGTGDGYYEHILSEFAHRYPEKLSVNMFFSNELANKIYAGSDMFLMPSLFEPCGLSQLIALRYGSIPIVRETGGLKDTIIPYNEFTGDGNGFSFSNYNAHEMLFTIWRAIELYYKDKHVWNKLVEHAMTIDYSWNKSANVYKDIYMNLIK